FTCPLVYTFLSIATQQPRSTLFPYTTLFRSARVRDHHNELRVSVVEAAAPARRFAVVFRVFNDGVGFRYEFPEQPGFGEFAITEDRKSTRLNSSHVAISYAVFCLKKKKAL